MRTQMQILGWLHIVTHALYVFAGVGVLMAGSAIAAVIAAAGGHDLMPVAAFVAGSGWIVAAVLLCMGLPGTIIGWGIARQAPWARIPGIILAVLNLPLFPWGTALGIYGLAVQFHPEAHVTQEPPRAIEYN